MKHNIFKLIFIACVVLIGNVSYADDANAPNANKASDESTAAKPGDTNTAKAADNSASGEKDVPKVGVTKLNTGATGRAIGNLLTHKAKPSKAGTSVSADSKKRIEELEELVQEQKKLLEMYKKQNK